MREILDRIEESIVEKFDNNLAKMFVMEAGTTLLNNGIKLWYTQKPIDTKVEETESGMVYTDTYEIKFDSIDTSEHDAKIRKEVIDECIRQVLEVYGKYPFELGFVLTAIEELKKED